MCVTSLFVSILGMLKIGHFLEQLHIMLHILISVIVFGQNQNYDIMTIFVR